MFFPFCEPFAGKAPGLRGFFVLLQPDPSQSFDGGTLTGELPNSAPGYSEPLCQTVKDNGTPGSPMYDSATFTWTGQKMMTMGHDFTLGMYAQHQGTFKWHVDGDDLVGDEVHLANGVPNGTYTLWMFNGAVAMSKMEKLSQVRTPVGKSDGSENVFTADATGRIDLTNVRVSGLAKPTGPKAFSFCYHLDGKTYGKELTPMEASYGADSPGMLTGVTAFDVLWGETLVK